MGRTCCRQARTQYTTRQRPLQSPAARCKTPSWHVCVAKLPACKVGHAASASPASARRLLLTRKHTKFAGTNFVGGIVSAATYGAETRALPARSSKLRVRAGCPTSPKASGRPRVRGLSPRAAVRHRRSAHGRSIPTLARCASERARPASPLPPFGPAGAAGMAAQRLGWSLPSLARLRVGSKRRGPNQARRGLAEALSFGGAPRFDPRQSSSRSAPFRGVGSSQLS